MEINDRIHAELQRKGIVRAEEHSTRTLVPRQDLTGADPTWAARYRVGDVMRYSRSSHETGIEKGQYAQVKCIHTNSNRLTVMLQDGTERTYDPRRQQGVSIFREETRRFSIGDRITRRKSCITECRLYAQDRRSEGRNEWGRRSSSSSAKG
jgi:hypothetical protein